MKHRTENVLKKIQDLLAQYELISYLDKGMVFEWKLPGRHLWACGSVQTNSVKVNYPGQAPKKWQWLGACVSFTRGRDDTNEKEASW